MENKYVESLVWLSRWYNGRAARLSRLCARHTEVMQEAIRKQLGSDVYRYQQELSINGIKVIVSCTPYQLTIHDVGDDRRLIGNVDSQLLLFSEGPEHRGCKVVRYRKLRLLVPEGGRNNA